MELKKPSAAAGRQKKGLGWGLSGRVVITGGAELTPSSEFRALSRTPLNSLFDLGQWDHSGTGEGRGGAGGGFRSEEFNLDRPAGFR